MFSFDTNKFDAMNGVKGKHISFGDSNNFHGENLTFIAVESLWVKKIFCRKFP